MAVCVVMPLLAVPASAQDPADPPDAKRVTVSGYLQAQYERIDTDGDARDRVFFRRMVLTLRGNVTDAWRGAVVFDLAPAADGDAVVIKDAYLQYTGWTKRGVTLTIGNHKMPFSRSLLASASGRALVERPFTGDRAFGSPGRAIGVRADGWNKRQTVYWAGTVASALHLFAADEIRIDGLRENRVGWNEGWTTAGRVEWHPFGEMPRAHGAFGRDGVRIALGTAAYAWRNDGDRSVTRDTELTSDSPAVDADSVNALEVSGGLRGRRISIEAEYDRVIARSSPASFTGGLYRNGEARLHKASIEAGYMVYRDHLEIVAGLDALEADVFARTWRRGAAGFSWYVRAHDVKFQLLHRVSWHPQGVADAKAHASYVQAQIAF